MYKIPLHPLTVKFIYYFMFFCSFTLIPHLEEYSKRKYCFYTLRLPHSIEFWRYRVLSGGNQRRDLPGHQIEEKYFISSSGNRTCRVYNDAHVPLRYATDLNIYFFQYSKREMSRKLGRKCGLSELRLPHFPPTVFTRSICLHCYIYIYTKKVFYFLF